MKPDFEPGIRPCFAGVNTSCGKIGAETELMKKPFVNKKLPNQLLFFGMLLLFAVGGICNPESSAFLCGTPYLKPGTHLEKADAQAGIENLKPPSQQPAIQTAPPRGTRTPGGYRTDFLRTGL